MELAGTGRSSLMQESVTVDIDWNTAPRDDDGREENEELIRKFQQLLRTKVSEQNANRRAAFIFQIPLNVVKENEECYVPQRVALGPYHFYDPALQSNLAFKTNAANNLASSSPTATCFESLHQRFQEWDPTIRQHYDRKLMEGSKTLAWMMAVDACFVAEWLHVFYSYTQQDQRSVDRSSALSLMRSIMNEEDVLVTTILKDIIKLECQIPLKLVEEAFTKRFPMESAMAVQDLFERIVRILCHHLSPVLRFNLTEEEFLRRGRHLLDSLLTFVLGFEAVPLTNAAVSCNNNNSSVRLVNIQKGKFMVKGRPLKTQDLPSASELRKAGIRFIPSDKGVGFISFDKQQNKFELPFLRLDDMTEIVMRNLMAYEICSASMQAKYVTRYCHLMETLIQSEVDVNVLKKEGVLCNTLTGDRNVQIWKSLVNSTRVPFIEGVEKAVEELAEVYARRKCTRWWNEYLEVYWSKPWIAISVIGATLLLLMTFIQVLDILCPSCMHGGHKHHIDHKPPV